MRNIIAIILCLLPILIPCFIAVVVPVSFRLKWVRHVRNIAIGMLLIIFSLELFMMPLDPYDSLATSTCAMQYPTLPILIYFSAFFLLLMGACKIAKFQCFKSWIMALCSAFLSCILFFPFFNGEACDEKFNQGIVSFAILELAIVSQVIYKKSLRKKI